DVCAWLETNWQGIFAGGPERTHAIAVSCQSKADVVARDERETGDRALLSRGHTFGHALEMASHYGSARVVHCEGGAFGSV
ncbi:3-dehydroquinate synthase, partial [Mycobacterium tuberculosis]|nr:3-dehydroquinate synthase [Mycobacterium tuberculosis]